MYIKLLCSEEVFTIMVKWLEKYFKKYMFNTGQSVPIQRHSQTRAKNARGFGDFWNLDVGSLYHTHKHINT